jgi:hypothetical protein
MKKFYPLISSLILLFTVAGANAQNGNNNNNNGNGGGFGQLIKSSPADATLLFQNYAEPMFKGFGIGLNSGWNNTAKTKKLLHFDLRITANVAQIPSSDQSFDVTKIGLSNHLQVDPASPTNMAPTFGGIKSGAVPAMDIKDNNGNTISTFNMPFGIIQYVPAPNVQLTIGLVYNTDITIRATPTIKIGSSGSVGIIGFGIKHDIIQDFAPKGKPYPFDVAIAVNYNKISYNKSLNVQPDAGTTGSSADFSTQQLQGSFSGTNVQAIISKKLLFFTPFLSIGYQSANTSLGVLGNYPVTTGAGTYSVVTDPVHINETSISGFRTDIGFQLNLLLLRIYASYSPGQYQSANAGIGLGF